MRRRGAIASVAVSALLAGPGSAGAGEESRLTTPVMSLTLSLAADGIEFCARGTAEEAGPWLVHVGGAQSVPSPLRALITRDELQAGARSYEFCSGVAPTGGTRGAFQIAFAFLGGSGSSGVARPSSVHAVAWWAPGVPGEWVVTPQM